jgi:protoporphyrinogen oxidase
MPGKIVINGSGISGLVCALLLCRKGAGPDVVIVDKNPEPGGLLRRFQYGEWGDFDYGMHNMLETGIADLDALLFGLLPEGEWQLLEDDRRDLAGIFFNGVLQRHTPYMDLRSLSAEDYRACVADLFAHLDGVELDAPVNTRATAQDFAIERFGELSARKTVIPAVEKVHQKSAAELDFMATIFTPMTRLAVCGETLAAEITKSPALRNRIAWPEQRSLPLERASGRRAFYPARYGIYRVVAAILERLSEGGVQIRTSADISAIGKADGRVNSVTVRAGGVEEVIDNVDRVIWTTNIPLLGRQLGVDFAGLKNDKPLKTVIVNLVVDRVPEGMGDLYYFFCYEPGFRTFRVTNYVNYSAGAPRNGGWPIGVELLVSEEEAASADLAALAASEYERFGISPGAKVLFAKAEILDSGFPMPTVNNIHSLRTIRNRIGELKLQNLDVVGILAEDNLFFQTDVLADAYRKVS